MFYFLDIYKEKLFTSDETPLFRGTQFGKQCCTS